MFWILRADSSDNSSTEADVKFVANQNITFNPVDGRGKSTDDSDTVVNKLIYMTDIETEAYAVYDGDKVVAIVKDQNDADELLLQTKADDQRRRDGHLSHRRGRRDRQSLAAEFGVEDLDIYDEKTTRSRSLRSNRATGFASEAWCSLYR